VRRVFILGLLGLLTLTLAACEKPDASYVTSPSMKTLIGTTVGNTAFNIPDTPPAAKDPPPGWQVDFDLIRWADLENGSPALQVIMQVKTQPGMGFELWVVDEGKTLARWNAGSTATFVGTACFQLELQRNGEAMPLGTGQHTGVLVFRNPDGEVVASRWLKITNNLPNLKGTAPSLGSEVIREAWACPRGQ
jgi:hypothetical protein